MPTISHLAWHTHTHLFHPPCMYLENRIPHVVVSHHALLPKKGTVSGWQVPVPLITLSYDLSSAIIAPQKWYFCFRDFELWIVFLEIMNVKSWKQLYNSLFSACWVVSFMSWTHTVAIHGHTQNVKVPAATATQLAGLATQHGSPGTQGAEDMVFTSLTCFQPEGKCRSLALLRFIQCRAQGQQ